MNLTHLHLVLNHIPVVGSLCGLGLLAFALWRHSEDVKRAALGVLAVSALIAIPAYMTGEPAEDGVRGLPGVSKALIERHEEAAGVALGGLLALGALALVGLIWFRGKRLLPAWFGAITLAGALIVSGLMAWAASLGGEVRHTEIRSGAATSLDPEQDHH
jgi:hypothetical protein